MGMLHNLKQFARVSAQHHSADSLGYSSLALCTKLLKVHCMQLPLAYMHTVYIYKAYMGFMLDMDPAMVG